MAKQRAWGSPAAGALKLPAVEVESAQSPHPGAGVCLWGLRMVHATHFPVLGLWVLLIMWLRTWKVCNFVSADEMDTDSCR